MRCLPCLSAALFSLLLIPTAAPAMAEAQHAPIEEEHEVIVVGAGIAGLSAASFATRDGWEVLVLEKSDRPGGRAVSGTHMGVSYPLGTEYLGPPEGALLELITMAGVQPLEIPAPMDAALHDGEPYIGETAIQELLIEQGGLEEFNRFAMLIAELAQRLDTDLLLAEDPELAALDSVTSAQWFRDMGFPAFFAQHYNVTSRGLFGAALGDISALSALPEIGFDFEGFEAVESPDDLGPDDPGSGAYSFARGIPELTDALAASLGERIRLSTTVRHVLRSDEGGFVVVCEDSSGQEHALWAEAVILAVPAPVALAIGDEVLDPEQKELIGQIPFAPYATAAVFSTEPIWDKAFDLSMPPGMLLTDIYDGTWMAKAADPAVADSGVNIACLYAAPDSIRDLALMNMSEQELWEAMLADLESALPGAAQTITGHELHLFRHAYPVMTPGSLERLKRLNELNRDGIYLAGDWMAYPTFEAAAESGLWAAKALDRDLE